VYCGEGIELKFEGNFKEFYCGLVSVEREFVEFFCVKENKWRFEVFKLLVESEKVFSRSSLFKAVNGNNLIDNRGRSMFDVFVSDLIGGGLVVQGEWIVSCFGKEKPLIKTESGVKVVKAVLWWNEFVKRELGKEVWE